MTEPLVGRYQLVHEIGRGGFGLVEEYRDLITGREVAIKTVAPAFIKQETKRLIREVDIMSFLYSAHPHVIDHLSMFVTQCRGTVDSKVSLPAPVPLQLNVLSGKYAGLGVDEKRLLHHRQLALSIGNIRKDDVFSLHIVMPLMKGDLTSFIKLCSSAADQQRLGLPSSFIVKAAVIFAFQVFFGLDYLHKCGIIHRDLKPENILVRLNDSDVFSSSACIADLGLARDAEDSETYYVCTRYYRAPEVVMTAIKGHPGLDVWSMGCILYEMCTNRTLFMVPSALDAKGAWAGLRASSQLEVILNIVGTPSVNDVLSYMPKGNAATYLQRSPMRPSRLLELLHRNWVLVCDEEDKTLWCDLIVRCLAFFPQLRPTAEEACAHPLFQKYNIYFGTNILQNPSRTYHPAYTDRETAHALTEDNKNRILDLVRRSMVATTPYVAPPPPRRIGRGRSGEADLSTQHDKGTAEVEDEDEDEEEDVDVEAEYAMSDDDYVFDDNTVESSSSSSSSSSVDSDGADNEERSHYRQSGGHRRSSMIRGGGGEQARPSHRGGANEEGDDEDEHTDGDYYAASSSIMRMRTRGSGSHVNSNSASVTAATAGTQQGSSSGNNNKDGAYGRKRPSVNVGKRSSGGGGDATTAALAAGQRPAVNEEDEDDYLPSAARFASVMGMSGFSRDADEEQNNSSTTTRLRSGRLQSRALGRRSSRGSLMHLSSAASSVHKRPTSGSDTGDGVRARASGGESSDNSLTTAPSVMHPMQRAPSVFYNNGQNHVSMTNLGNLQQRQQQQQQQQPPPPDSNHGNHSNNHQSANEDVSFGTMSGNTSGWYSASFFNFENAASASGVRRDGNTNSQSNSQSATRPRAGSSGTAVMTVSGGGDRATLGASVPSLGVPGSAFPLLKRNNNYNNGNHNNGTTAAGDAGHFSSPAADALQALGQQQARVGNAQNNGREGDRTSTNLNGDRRNQGNHAGLHKVPDMRTAAQQRSGDRGNHHAAPPNTRHFAGSLTSVKGNPSAADDNGVHKAYIEELADYGYLVEDGLDTMLDLAPNAGNSGGHGPSPPALAFSLADNVSQSGGSGSHLSTGDYMLRNLRNLRTPVTAPHNRSEDHKASTVPPQPPATSGKVQPLEPMNNNYFSAVNLGAMRLGNSGTATLADSLGFEEPPPNNYKRSGEEGGSGGVATANANRFTSTTSYHLNFENDIASVRRGSPTAQRNGNGNLDARANHAHLLDDEEDEWIIPAFSSDAGSGSLARPLGIGIPTQSRPSQNNNNNNRNRNEVSAVASPASILSLMEKVTMGGAVDADPLHATTVPQLWGGGSASVREIGGGNRKNNNANSSNRRKLQRSEAAAGENAMGGGYGGGDNSKKKGGVNVGEDPDFPTIADTALRLRFRTVEASDRGAQGAITEILSELGSSTHNVARSEQLRALLSYFTSLQYSLKATD